MNLIKAEECVLEMQKYFTLNEENANVGIPNSIKVGSIEYFYYIFYSCLLDYGMRSKIYHNNLIKSYELNSNIFNPRYVVDSFVNNESELLTFMKDNIHPRYPNIAVKKWLKLSIYLNEFYPEESLESKIMSLNSSSDLNDFIMNVPGYGQKTGGLLIRSIFESGIKDFKDELKSIPIDSHDIEISYLNGVIEKERINQEEIRELSDTWIKAAHKYGVNASDIDKYLWSIGNTLCTKRKCIDCPLKFNCKKFK